MQTIARSLLSAGFALFLSAPAWAASDCIVSDPTGTPLNVRTAPNSRVLRTLRNGTPVNIEQVVTGPDGKRWAFVTAPNGDAHGWVFYAFLACR